MITVGDVKIDSPVFLAPMSGATDAPFRKQATRFGAPVVVTEMIAGSELATGRKDMVLRIAKPTNTYPFVVQLAGREPDWMFEAAKISAAADADIIDINMGCPSRQVTGGQSGAALMKDLGLARELIIAARDGGLKPVSVKMRLGWDDDTLNAPELAGICEEEGVKLLTVHGRTRCQFYTGKADWLKVKRVKDSCSLPLIVNGDIHCVETARKAISESGADGVMIGRSAMGRPWLLAKIAADLGGKSYIEPSWHEKIESLCEQATDCVELYGERIGIRVFRKHVAAFVDTSTEMCLDENDRQILRGKLCRISDCRELHTQMRDLLVKNTERELVGV